MHQARARMDEAPPDEGAWQRYESLELHQPVSTDDMQEGLLTGILLNLIEDTVLCV